MEAGISPARQTRAQHRHQLRTLTYVTLDQANGGVVRNLTDEGMGLQVVSAVRPRQQLQVRFELRYPKLRVEARGEVIWATFSGECGIRFLDMSPRTTRQINEWIFGNLLEEISIHADTPDSMFSRESAQPPGVAKFPDSRSGPVALPIEDDGLLVSPTPVNVIELPTRREPPPPAVPVMRHYAEPDPARLDWLSQPLSGKALAWTIHSLVVVAGLLLFSLVFLSVTREAPRWPLPMAGGAALVVAVLYWVFFEVFGGSTLGARLERLAGYHQDDEETDARFR
jgi:hypothetical protein